MTEITLAQYLKNHSQTEAAEALGVNQSAVSQMIKSGRDVRLLIDGRGVVKNTYEIRPIGRSAIQVA